MSKAIACGDQRIFLAVLKEGSCFIPVINGALFSIEWKDALWARFYTGAPR